MGAVHDHGQRRRLIPKVVEERDADAQRRHMDIGHGERRRERARRAKHAGKAIVLLFAGELMLRPRAIDFAMLRGGDAGMMSREAGQNIPAQRGLEDQRQNKKNRPKRRSPHQNRFPHTRSYWKSSLAVGRGTINVRRNDYSDFLNMCHLRNKHAPPAYGCGRGVVATDGGMMGKTTSGWRPVNDLRKSVTFAASSSESFTPSWASAMISTAFFKSHV